MKKIKLSLKELTPGSVSHIFACLIWDVEGDLTLLTTLDDHLRKNKINTKERENIFYISLYGFVKTHNQGNDYFESVKIKESKKGIAIKLGFQGKSHLKHLLRNLKD